MSKNELTPEVLTKLENAALGTLAKKSKEGDAVAARVLLDRVDKIRQKPRSGRIPLVTDPAEAAALIASAPRSRNRATVVDGVIPLPPVPGIELEPADYLEGIYMIMAWAITEAARRGHTGQVLKTVAQMRKIYNDHAKIREPGRRSIWEGTPELQRPREDPRARSAVDLGGDARGARRAFRGVGGDRLDRAPRSVRRRAEISCRSLTSTSWKGSASATTGRSRPGEHGITARRRHRNGAPFMASSGI